MDDKTIVIDMKHDKFFLVFAVVVMIVVSGCVKAKIIGSKPVVSAIELPTFESCEELSSSFGKTNYY